MTSKSDRKSLRICACKPAATRGAVAGEHASSKIDAQHTLKARASRALQGLWHPRALRAALLVIPVTMLAGCAGLVTSNGTKSQTPLGNIQVSPGTFNFGSVTVGKKVSQTATVSNTGSASISVGSATISSGVFSVSGLAMPATLGAGQSGTFQVWFEPSAAGSASGTLTLQSSDGSVSTQVSLAGTGTAAPQQISVSTTNLNLGSAKVGTTDNSALGISNSGGANLTISLVTVSGAPFGVSGITTPSTVAPGGNVNLGVTFSPTAVGTDSGSVTITSNDPVNPTMTVALSGTATASAVAPGITTQPVSQTVTAGQTATFSVVASGTAPLTYQWQKNGVNIASATATSYTTPATTTADSGATFDVVVTNTAGSATSNAATLTVNPAPVAPAITTQPVNQTVTAGQTATFSVVASGTAPLSYQWQKNGVNIAGATSASYTTPATTTADSGATFDVVVTNTAGSATSNAATLTVSPAPVAPAITTQPVNQTVTAGQTATFSVVASGTAPLSYQWQKNGANIAGATATSYTTPATTTADSGATFDVVVTNTAGSATSNGATLTVNPAPVAPAITTQPVNQTVTAGQTATFSLVASGTAPLSYQWQKNGVNIAGATSASYTTPATTTADSGATFDVVVTNTAGSATSNAATLTVSPAPVAPAITTQPVNQTVTAGQTATFSVVASGTAPLSYQWQKNGANIAGATATSYTTPATTTADSGATFDVVVTNTAGSATSNAATLTVNPAPVAPAITTQPVNQTVTAGQTATFSVVASGTAPLTYQWQKNGVNIAGATATSYTTPATTTADSGATFDVVVTNTAGSATSNAATLTVNPAPVAPAITTQPVNQTVTAGQTATFSVVASGTAPLSYQWQKNGANIAGATATSYTTPATTTADSGATFDVVVTNTAGSATSNAATLTVNPAPVAPAITTQPVNQTVTAGQTATFSVVASGTAPLSYQWQKNGANIAGATSASYTTPATTSADNGSTFKVVVTNTAGSATSNAATLTVNAPAIQVSSSSINFGNDVVGVLTSQSLIITNSGTAALTITQINPTGAAFSASGFTLPLNVNAGKTANISIGFQPTLVGAAAGSISIVSNAPTSPTSVTLSGTGIAATFTLSINPTSLTFGNVVTNTTSAAQDVTITNTGNSSVTISQITLAGTGYSMTGGGAPVTLTPNQNVILAVQFGPTATGAVAGSITIVSNATGSPATVALTGTGVVPPSVTLGWTASTSTVAGYNIYRGTISGGPYVKVNTSLITSLAYTDTTVQSGTTYFYVATAVDSSGNESVNSNEVSAPVP